MTPSKTNCFELNDSNKNKVCQSIDQIKYYFFKKKLPEIDVDAFIMERILNSSAYDIKRIVYQGFNTTINVNGESMYLLLDSFLIK